jgi:decaprenylphospho-beta-D-erythro-pentofuranosid-2-ulose 2-reductase
VPNVLIVGATSAIAQATARRYARPDTQLYLLARNGERLQGLAADLRIRGAAGVEFAILDIDNSEQLEAVVPAALERLGTIDIALIAYGTLGNQRGCEQSVALTLQTLHVNLTSVIVLLTQLANHFEVQGRGTIAVIGSVAGDRGRQSNYVYGTCKGALAVFLQGLRNRLWKRGVNVLTIKPGFVDTPMTAAFAKGPLWASADQVARGIVKAVSAGSTVVYLPFWWRYVMWIIKAVPEAVFRRLSL